MGREMKRDRWKRGDKEEGGREREEEVRRRGEEEANEGKEGMRLERY